MGGLVIEDYYQATLSGRMDIGATDFPLEQRAYVGLLEMLPAEGDYFYMTIRSPVSLETVKAKRVGPGIFVERGLAGTKEVTHPYGAVISTPSPTIVALLMDLTGNSQS